MSTFLFYVLMWYLAGFTFFSLYAYWDYIHGEAITREYISTGLLGSLLGPILFFIFIGLWFSENQSKVIFQKKPKQDKKSIKTE